MFVVTVDADQGGDWREGDGTTPKQKLEVAAGIHGGGSGLNAKSKAAYYASMPASVTTGWQPSCTCDAGDPVPQIVLDPFCGSGTTGVVALRHGRSFVGVELNPEYARLAERRIRGDAPLFNVVEVA